MHGLFAVHLKMYPVIYLPSIYLSLSTVYSAIDPIDKFKRFLLNRKGILFVAVSSSKMSVKNGQEFLISEFNFQKLIGSFASRNVLSL